MATLRMESTDLVARLELQELFDRNPYAWDTATGFARKLGRNPDLVKRALQDLERLGLVTGQGTGARKVYGCWVGGIS